MAEEVEKAIAEVLEVFYREHWEPRLDRVEAKQAEHSEKFRDILGYFDQLDLRLTSLGDEYPVIAQGRGWLANR